MFKALVLDARINAGQYRVHAAMAAVGLVGCAWWGVLSPFWLLAALWLAGLGSAHRDLRPLGDVGGLQRVLGVPRAEAVRARYLGLAGTAGVVLAATGVVVLAWSALGWNLATALVVPPLVAAVVTVSAVRLTLGYCASPAWQQAVTVTLIGLLMGIGTVPFVGGADLSDSTRGLVDLLYSGPVPLVLAVAAVAALVIGCRLAERAHARTDL